MEKKSKKSIVIGITSLFLVMLILVGLTYAYYRTRVIGNDNETSISVQSKKMEITYHDGSAVLSTEGLIEPGFTATKEFSVENTGTETSTFSIMLDNVVNEYNKDTERGEYNDWKYYLYSGSVVNPDNLIKEGEITTDTVQYIIESVSINAEETKNYILKVEYKDLEDIDQSLDMGSKFSLRVNIGDEYEVEYTWDKAPSGTLLYALRTNQPTGTEETIPGQAASTANEARILETEDDYGTSYVYRGNVTNNYVNFSGMCWRIVRIQGDGTTKLILADENGECNADTYSLENETSAFMYNLEQGDNRIFHAGYIPTELITWRDEKNLNTAKMEYTNWCVDTSITNVNSYNPGLDDFWYTDLDYSSYTRLIDRSNPIPSLKCDFTGKNNSTATRINDNIGLLTADEVAFAGGTVGIHGNSFNYYLQDNANDEYLTLTPMQYLDCCGLYVASVSSTGTILTNGMSSAGRPAIVLRSDVTLSTNTTSTQVGTQTNPYVID